MPDPATTRPIVLLGPTAGGKSDLAAEIAHRLGGEVIGADSMQVYRHLDAGTAKPPPALRARVPHRLIDLVEPTERFTVHDWLGRATAEIDRVQNAGGTPVVVGGTNLYLKALLDGMFAGPGQDPCFRASLEAIETPRLHERLRQVDPESADRVKPADRQRIVRALEVYQLIGQPISAMQTQWEGKGPGGQGAKGPSEQTETSGAQHTVPRPLGPSAPSPFRLLGLRWSAEKINPRINLRVKAMFYPDKVDPQLAAEVCIHGESLIDETRRLQDEGMFEPISTNAHADEPRDIGSGTAPLPVSAPNQAREALGYKQLLAVLEKTDPKLKTIDDAYERTKVLTRRFAKQQRTWLKRFTGTHWIDCDDTEPREVADRALAWAARPAEC